MKLLVATKCKTVKLQDAYLAGAVAGLIDRGDIVRTLAQKLNLRITDAEIKRLKEEGSYPPGLELGAIAKSPKN